MPRIILSFALIVLVTAMPHDFNVSASCYINNAPIENMCVNMYYVADSSGQKFEWTDSYAGLPNLDLTETASLQQCAIAASARVDGQGYKPDYSQITDNKGLVMFHVRKTGLYLIKSPTLQIGDTRYKVNPTLVYIDTNTELDLKLQAENVPKQLTTVSVVKTWILSDSDNKSPVTIGLFCNDVLSDTVILSDDNNWSHSWSGLDQDAVWTVKEMQVPDGFIAELHSDGSTYAITNTSVNKIKVTPQTGLYEDITYTGYILLLLTLILLPLAILMTRKGESNEHKSK